MPALRCIAVLLLAATGAVHAQRIEVTPDAVLAGEPVRIVLKGFPRDADVTLRAERAVRGWMPGTAAKQYRAEAVFRTTHAGTLDLATARSLSGDYTGVDLRGLFWSMKPTGADAAADASTEVVTLSAHSGDAVAAQARLTLREADPAVVVTAVEDPDLPGALLARLPGDRVRPAIIVLGGSEGGDWFAKGMAPRLASHGYAVFGLPYYAPAWLDRQDLATLPSDFADIPVERLELARDWLAQQPGIDAARIGVYGVSKGAEFALLAATRFEWIDAVVAIVPSDVVWEGFGMAGVAPGERASFAWRGEPLPFVPYRGLQAEFMAMASGQAVLRRAHDHGRAAHPQRANAARIPVERYAGALLVAGGMQDKVWGSGPMAQNIAERRAAAGLDTATLVFHDAGHSLSGHGWSPTTQVDGPGMAMGGSAAGTAQAQAETWRETLALLARTLQPPSAHAPR